MLRKAGGEGDAIADVWWPVVESAGKRILSVGLVCVPDGCLCLWLISGHASLSTCVRSDQ